VIPVGLRAVALGFGLPGLTFFEKTQDPTVKSIGEPLGELTAADTTWFTALRLTGSARVCCCICGVAMLKNSYDVCFEKIEFDLVKNPESV